MPEILVFGDSIPAGAIDPEGGWVVRLREYLIRNGFIDWSTFLYNLSADVDTSAKILARVDAETKRRVFHKEDSRLFIFSFGQHDTVFFKDGRITTSKKDFESNVRAIISWQKKIGGTVFFVGISPVNEEKTRPVSYSTTGKNVSNKNISEYNSILRKVCGEEGILFIDIFDKMVENVCTLFLDGVYPNNNAHGIILKLVIEQLEKNNILADWPKRNWSAVSHNAERG